MTAHEVNVAERGGRLLSVNEVAALLGVSRQTVYRLVRARQLPASRVSERLRFRQSHVDDYIDRRRVG
jgi:excisionase family DNA binding protein